MLRQASLFLMVAMAAAIPYEKIMEGELTAIIREALAPHDPKLIPAITNLNIATEHGSFLFNATDVSVSGFGLIEVTNFVPPVPLLSKHVKLSFQVPLLTAITSNYALSGTHNGELTESSGVGELKFTKFGLTVDFKADSYSLEPMSVCMQPGSFSIDLSVELIESNLEGAGEINDDINADGPALLDGVEAQINENSAAIEDAVNNALCVQLKN